MELIDTHCHIDVAEFDVDRDEVIERARAVGVTRIVVPAIDAANAPALLSVCARYKGLFPALGLHPIYVERHTDGDLITIETLLSTHRPVAVGEIGLDFFVTELDRDKQKMLFKSQLLIARDARLPVLLHIRKAYDEVLAALRRTKVCGGIAHAFNGSAQQAHQFIDLGFKLGFGGNVTYDRANHIRSLARTLPLEAIVLETDAPDMTVSSHRGERNSPEYLPQCLQAIAQLREVSAESVAVATSQNACHVLELE